MHIAVVYLQTIKDTKDWLYKQASAFLSSSDIVSHTYKPRYTCILKRHHLPADHEGHQVLCEGLRGPFSSALAGNAERECCHAPAPSVPGTQNMT